MIVGRGLVASAFAPRFADDDGIIIFASGVSNSRENRREEFEREEKLLTEKLALRKRLIYFGSCSVLDPAVADTPYVQHKLRMERLVSAADDYLICRLSQVVGRTDNPHHLTNFLYEKISTGEPFPLFARASRNIINVADVAAIVAHLMPSMRNATVNIACPFSVPVVAIVAAFEKVLHKTANYTPIDAGGCYDIATSEAERAARDLAIIFDETYLERTIRTYYGA